MTGLSGHMRGHGRAKGSSTQYGNLETSGAVNSMVYGLWLVGIPICSMYGIFTYKTGS